MRLLHGIFWAVLPFFFMMSLRDKHAHEEITCSKGPWAGFETMAAAGRTKRMPIRVLAGESERHLQHQS